MCHDVKNICHQTGRALPCPVNKVLSVWARDRGMIVIEAIGHLHNKDLCSLEVRGIPRIEKLDGGYSEAGNEWL